MVARSVGVDWHTTWRRDVPYPPKNVGECRGLGIHRRGATILQVFLCVEVLPMSFRDWFRFRLPVSSSARTKPARAARFTPRLECLEGRELLSASNLLALRAEIQRRGEAAVPPERYVDLGYYERVMKRLGPAKR